MYGLVNMAIEDLVTINFGADKWAAVKKKAGVEVDRFNVNEGYPDCITYGLVKAASEVLELPVEKILFAFGEFWVLHTAQKGYGDMLSAAGRDLPEFLEYLPTFHVRVALMFPHLQPPRFECSDREANKITMHYYSHRAGLSVFVEGLLHGVAKLYNTPASVEQTKFKDKGDDHDEFLVCWGDAIKK
ncbi:MAG: heme NO-binding domain-containing protein [Planctomycetota bacterium]|nr:heme NO-binding domain-containing protein [Planctomycetota bacterium]